MKAVFSVAKDCLRGAVKKKPSIFTDIVQIGGSTPFKKIKRNQFLTKVGEGGVTKSLGEKFERKKVRIAEKVELFSSRTFFF